jgi:hypothetical protein
MKKFKIYIGLALVSMILFSCTKTPTFNYPDGYVGISKITNYPTITLNGATYMAVAKGTTFTDPGAIAIAGGKSIPVTASGTVNTNTVGVYLVSYTAVNSDGFPASGIRYVAVYSTDATAQANDFTGTYLRASTGATAVWTKVAPGVYTINNPGGAVGVNLTVFAFNPTGYTISIPPQIAGGSPTSSSTESTVPGAGGTLVSYMMKIINPGYGTSTRSFVKQ